MNDSQGRTSLECLLSPVSTVAVQRETRTIPIVFGGVTDPVASGMVARLDRPSGNITGFG